MMMMMMSYKNDSILVIVNRYGKAEGAAKVELYETYDRIRELAVSGNGLGGNGLGKFSSLLTNVARTFGSTAFVPTLGSESITIPGTSYYAPISGGTGITPGGQAAFGLTPFSNYTGYPTGNAAGIAGLGGGLGVLNPIANLGIGSLAGGALGLGGGFSGVGDVNFPASGFIGGDEGDAISELGFSAGGNTGGFASPFFNGQVVGGAGGVLGALGSVASGAVGTAAAGATGVASGLGFGRNWVMPAASLASGLGGLLTTLGPLFGPIGLAGVAAGGILNGIAGTVLSGYQKTSQRVLANADTVLGEKVRNLETTMKMLSAQSEVLKKMLKDSADSDKKALDNL
jgi:hypothetical protein